MKSYDWNEMIAHQQEGRLRRVIAGERMTVLRQVIPSGPDSLGAHSHPQEQISIVLEGRARFTCADEEVTLGPGGAVIFPPDTEHSTQNLEDGDLVVEEIFSPGVERLNKLAPQS